MTPARRARCLTAGCPFTMRSGPDRLCPSCRDGARPRPVTTLAQSQRWRAGRVRIMAALVRDPMRSNRVIADAVRAGHPAVRRVRLELEAAGAIPVFRAKGAPGPRRAPAPAPAVPAPVAPAVPAPAPAPAAPVAPAVPGGASVRPSGSCTAAVR